MKNFFKIILLLFTIVGNAQVQTITPQLKLATVNQGSASDSVLVRGADKIIKYVKKSDLLGNVGLTSTSITGTDLDVLQELGFYYGGGLTHAPEDNVGDWFVNVETFLTDKFKQTATSNGNSNTPNRTFIRVGNPSSWSAWKEIGSGNLQAITTGTGNNETTNGIKTYASSVQAAASNSISSKFTSIEPNGGLYMKTANLGTGLGIGLIQATNLNSILKTFELPNKSGTFALLDDVVTPTLQQVLTAGSTLTNNNNFQGASAGLTNTGNNTNAFGFEAGRASSGTFGNLFGYGAGYSNTGTNLNAFGGNAGKNNTGTNSNLFGGNAGFGNTGNFVNFIGSSAGNGNTAADVNGLGNQAGSLNTGTNSNFMGNEAGKSNSYSDVNLFGRKTTASGNGQVVFSKYVNLATSLMARISYNSITDNRLYTLPDKTGTFAMLDDISGDFVLLTEGAKTGYATKHRKDNPTLYGDIGDAAVDLTKNETASSTVGATGDYSFAVGYGNTASNLGSTVGGGYYNEATGSVSTVAGGYSNKATAIRAVVSGGDTNTASGGNASIVGGLGNVASGHNSVVGGNNNEANAYGQVAFGNFSVTASGQTAGSPVTTDEIMKIGNGTGDLTRSNAFLLYRNGLGLLPSVTNSLINADATGKALTTKEWVESLVPYKSFTAFYTIEYTEYTEGPLVIGNTYFFTDTPAVGDDFTNVGWDGINIDGFVATGTTPTNWTNGTVLYNDVLTIENVFQNNISPSLIIRQNLDQDFEVVSAEPIFIENKFYVDKPLNSSITYVDSYKVILSSNIFQNRNSIELRIYK